MTITTSRVQLRIASRDGGSVAHVTIDHAAKINILDGALISEFIEKVTALSTHDDLRAVVLTGAGDKSFIGGADIREMAALTPESAEAFITRLHAMCACLRDLPVPVIARINGYAIGAGLEVAAACDLRVASSNAIFGMPEVRVGIPSVIEAALLPSLIGWGRTRELLYLGENIDAQEALRWGLVERVVAPSELDSAVEAWLQSLFKAGPKAIRLQKTLIRQWEQLPLGEAIQAGIKAYTYAYLTDEPARMMQSFLDRPRR
jgi:enoyl-CoA hydratase/carnithine racemase